jgi:hypothetical protein
MLAPGMRLRLNTRVMSERGLRPVIETGQLHHSPHPRKANDSSGTFSSYARNQDSLRRFGEYSRSRKTWESPHPLFIHHNPVPRDSERRRARSRGGSSFDSHAPRGVGTRTAEPTSAWIGTPSEIHLTMRIRLLNQRRALPTHHPRPGRTILVHHTFSRNLLHTEEIVRLHLITVAVRLPCGYGRCLSVDLRIPSEDRASAGRTHLRRAGCPESTAD